MSLKKDWDEYRMSAQMNHWDMICQSFLYKDVKEILYEDESGQNLDPESSPRYSKRSYLEQYLPPWEWIRYHFGVTY